MRPIELGLVGDLLQATPAGPASQEHVATSVGTDSRTITPGQLFFAIAGERFDGHDFVPTALRAGAVAAVVARPIPEAEGPTLLVDDVLTALHRLASWARRQFAGTVVGITGASGKTTTKAMLHHVLSGAMRGSASVKSFNNHLGVPLTLLAADPDDGYLVVEIGTNHPGEVRQLATLAHPDVCVVTSLAESHLEGLGDLEGVAAEELSQLPCRSPGGLAAVNADHPLLRAGAASARGPVLTFGLSPESQLRATVTDVDDTGLRFTLTGRRPRHGRFDQTPARLPVHGRHNASNAAAVWAVAAQLGLDDSLVQERLASFSSPEGRNRLVSAGRVTLLDDVYNANPGSLRAGLSTLADLRPAPGGRRVAILGDMLELGAASELLHRQLGRSAVEAGVDALVTVGPRAQALGESFVELSSPPRPWRHFDDAPQAASAASELAEPGDVVLLKASRGVRLELLRDALLRCHGSASPA